MGLLGVPERSLPGVKKNLATLLQIGICLSRTGGNTTTHKNVISNPEPDFPNFFSSLPATEPDQLSTEEFSKLAN
jgi:hypothetical protein